MKVIDHRIKTKSTDDYNLLKKSHCGFEGRTIKVCCPLEDISPDSTGSKEIEEDIPSTYDGISSRLPSQTTCGKIDINQDRIIGGNAAQLGKIGEKFDRMKKRTRSFNFSGLNFNINF